MAKHSAGKPDIERLFSLLRGAKYCTVLSGAGVSTLSGIRDFRGKNGLYREMDAEKIFDVNYFFRDPSFYYSNAKNFIYDLEEKKPSVVHLVLADLERRGMVKSLITQNIDLLHARGGSKKVIEIHGSPEAHYCPACQSSAAAGEAVLAGKVAERGFMTFEEAAAVVQKDGIPRCPSCGGALKPAITFFGENLPAAALAAAEAEARKADLMLVLGTSLTVFPAAALPRLTLGGGGSVVIVNNMETPLDSCAALRFDDLGIVFEGIKSILEKKQ